MRVLLVEPWLDGSHRQWAEGYQQASVGTVDIIGLSGQLWRWRLRGGAVPLAVEIEAWVEANGRPDVVLVSGLVDVAHLLGLARRSLGSTPVAVYQHESQLVYPTATGPDQEAALRNWLSWCAADLVLFNTDSHRRAVVDALPAYLEQLPDRSHRPRLDEVVARFDVLPVGLDLGPLLQAPRPSGDRLGTRPPVIVWPHRWEADKDPAAFLTALTEAADASCRFGLILAGPDPAAGSSQASAARQAVVDAFPQRILAVGPFPADEYRRRLAQADLVVSSARQENFGVGVVEAVAAGCVPLLPARLAYPEIIPERWHRVALYQPGELGAALVEALTDLDRRREATRGLAATMARFDWTQLGPRYDQILGALASADPGARD